MVQVSKLSDSFYNVIQVSRLGEVCFSMVQVSKLSGSFYNVIQVSRLGEVCFNVVHVSKSVVASRMWYRLVG